MSGLNIGNAPKNYAVLPFYATGAVFFLILTLLMFFAAEHFEGHYFQAQLLALVHTAALGWATMVIFGAAYQLLPVICERNLYSSSLAFISYCFLLLGTLLLICTFWFFKTGVLMIIGGSFVFTASILYLINVFKTANIRKNFPIEKAFLISSAIWFVITTSIGLLLAINLAYPFFSQNHLEILKLHAHVGLGGWFLQLITGVSIKLIPMFLLGKSTKVSLLKAAFILQNLGLIGFLMDQYFLGTSLRVYFYLILVGFGILCWILYLKDVFIHRIRRKLYIQSKHTLLSFLSLSFAFILMIFAISFSDSKWSILYVTFLFLGWITALILGKTFKTLPFIIWNNHYKNLHGKMKIPLPKDLYNNNWLIYQFWCLVFAILFLALGIIFNQSIIIKMGLMCWIAVAILYLSNVIKLFFHKTQSHGT